MLPYPRTVWVLGAGFSRPVGGPLLPDLFSAGSRERILAAFGGAEKFGELLTGLATQVRTLYAEHGRNARSQHWGDAEQFLEALDTAAVHPDSPAANLVRALLGGDVDVMGLANMARRLVAAECAAFLVGADPTSEKWAPYTRWLHSLGEHDSIITFNYDVVLEMLARATGFERLATALPGCGLAEPPKVNLFKLHGSVNWKWEDSRFHVVGDDAFALKCPAEQMVIASPGPAKLATTERLAELWTAAHYALRNASAVVFIGYRFPPSDSSSRRRLFAALVQNDQPYLALHTVLGPNVSDPATVRIRSLLLHAARQGNREEAPRTQALPSNFTRRLYTLDVHPLWAEDFMDVMENSHVYQAYSFPRA